MVEQRKKYKELGVHDVLIVKGLHCLHPGNTAYQKIVLSRVESYQTAKVGEKRTVAQQVIDQLSRLGGRFMRRNADGVHHVMSETETIRVVMTAFHNAKRKLANAKEDSSAVKSSVKKPAAVATNVSSVRSPAAISTKDFKRPADGSTKDFTIQVSPSPPRHRPMRVSMVPKHRLMENDFSSDSSESELTDDSESDDSVVSKPRRIAPKAVPDVSDTNPKAAPHSNRLPVQPRTQRTEESVSLARSTRKRTAITNGNSVRRAKQRVTRNSVARSSSPDSVSTATGSSQGRRVSTKHENDTQSQATSVSHHSVPAALSASSGALAVAKLIFDDALEMASTNETLWNRHRELCQQIKTLRSRAALKVTSEAAKKPLAPLDATATPRTALFQAIVAHNAELQQEIQRQEKIVQSLEELMERTTGLREKQRLQHVQLSQVEETKARLEDQLAQAEAEISQLNDESSQLAQQLDRETKKAERELW